VNNLEIVSHEVVRVAPRRNMPINLPEKLALVIEECEESSMASISTLGVGVVSVAGSDTVSDDSASGESSRNGRVTSGLRLAVDLILSRVASLGRDLTVRNTATSCNRSKGIRNSCWDWGNSCGRGS
jgi:hypothetical protein